MTVDEIEPGAPRQEAVQGHAHDFEPWLGDHPAPGTLLVLPGVWRMLMLVRSSSAPLLGYADDRLLSVQREEFQHVEKLRTCRP